MSTTQVETEIALCVLLENFEGLDQADMIEDHVQFEATLTTGARVRVRKVTPIKGGAEEKSVFYEHTLKVKSTEADASLSVNSETNVSVDRGYFEAFALAASQGVVKRRYSFMGKSTSIDGYPDLVVPPVTYEVDVYTTEDKRKSLFVKIDIELDKVFAALANTSIDLDTVKHKLDLSGLPLNIKSAFAMSEADETQGKVLDFLWQKEYRINMAPEVYSKTQSE